MKCYFCGGQDNAHRLPCPKQKEQNPKKIKKEVEEDYDSIVQSLQILKRPGSGLKPPSFSTRTSFLPLEKENYPIAAMNTCTISACPMLPSKPQRFWIDENIASAFDIGSFRIGVQELMCGSGWIPAILFRTGRWPLLTKVDADTQYGIDLSSWPTMQAGVIFSMRIRNNSGAAMPFKGCLEVLTISQ